MSGQRGDPEKRGLIPNSFEHIFSHIACTQDEQYLVRVSYLEIYKVRACMCEISMSPVCVGVGVIFGCLLALTVGGGERFTE